MHGKQKYKYSSQMRITIFKTYYWLIHRCKIMVNMFSACECLLLVSDIEITLQIQSDWNCTNKATQSV